MVIESLIAFTLASAGPAPDSGAGPPISTGRRVALTEHLGAEKPSVFVFFKPSSSLERSFVIQLRKTAGQRVALREVCLKSGDEPVAQQYQVTGTPSALVYDRRGRLVGRSASAEEIQSLVARAAGVMRIDWAEPGDPRFGEMEKILGRAANNGIMRTMSLRPEWMRKIYELHSIEHRPDTALDRRTKEMIATYVSAVNHCKF
jgi:hypothetical protein